MIVEGGHAESMINDEINKLEEIGKPISYKPKYTKVTPRSMKVVIYIAVVYCGGLLMGFGPLSANMLGWLVVCSVFGTVILVLIRVLGFKSQHTTPSHDISFDSIDNASTTSMTTKTTLGGDY